MTRGVLEENVRRLLRRSYVPALPAPAFRDRLASLIVNEVQGRARARRGAREFRRLSTGTGWAVAAAVVVVLLGGWWLGRGSPTTREGLVERGEVALGFPDGTWRAADEEERFHGLHFDGAALRIVTPEEVRFELLVGAGRVELEERSELSLARDADDVSALLERGAATFVSFDQREDLRLGSRTILRRSGAPVEREAASAREPAAPSAPTPAPLALTAQPAPRAFAGHVVDAENGAAIESFTIGLLGKRVANRAFPPVRQDFRAPEGFFTWNDPPAEKQRVFVHAPGYVVAALGEFDFSAPPELLVELERGERLRGSVLDAQGNPVPDALVYAEDEAPSDGLMFLHSEHAFWIPNQARTGADGRFTLESLARGAHTLRVEAAGYAMARRAGVPVPLNGEELTLTLGPGGAISGRIERDDGGPWAEAEVVVVAMDRDQGQRTSVAVTRTDLAGRYRFEHLPAVTMLVLVMRAEDRPDVRPVEVMEATTVTVDFLAPRRGVRLEGRLFDHEKKPLPLRNLGLFERETANWSENWVASTTNAEGGYAFEGAAPGRYVLYLVDDLGSGVRCLDEVTLPEGASIVQHDLIAASGALDVEVRAADDARALAQVDLLVLRRGLDTADTEDFEAYGSSGADGRCRITPLRAGRYTVVAYPRQADLGFERSAEFELADGEARALALELGPGMEFTVVARSADGQALGNAYVTVHDEGGHAYHLSRTPLTDDQGRYRAPGLPPGHYRLEVEREGFQTAELSIECQLGRELVVPIVLVPRTSPR